MKSRCCSRFFAFAALTIATGQLCPGQVLTSEFPETVIPDGNPAGVTFEFTRVPAIASVTSIKLTLAHEWLGDLTVRLIPPVGPGFTLFNRVDVSPGSPDGSSAILGSFIAETGVFRLVPQPYQFAATGEDFAAEARLAVDAQNPPVIPPSAIYAAESWESASFPAGAWKLFLSDSAEGSSGVIRSAEIAYTPIPEPASLALLFLAAVISPCFRRRRGLLAEGPQAVT